MIPGVRACQHCPLRTHAWRTPTVEELEGTSTVSSWPAPPGEEIGSEVA